jgi:hypothetical protein
LTCIVLMKPVPAPTKTPVGPYMLSIQPQTGSLRVPTTVTATKELINHSQTVTATKELINQSQM